MVFRFASSAVVTAALVAVATWGSFSSDHVVVNALRVSSSSLPHVDAGVHRTLRAQGTVNLILTMASRPEKEVLETLQESEFATRGEKITNLVTRLEEHSKNTQQQVVSLAIKEAFGEFEEMKSFWISNQIFVKNASPQFLEKALGLESVLEIREEMIIPLMKPIIDIPEVSSNDTSTLVNGVEWGVDKVQAPQVWATGNKGEGVIVGSIDTGVLATHEILKDSFVDSHGWYDPEKKAAAPYDVHGHGTHTMGTIAGANGVGVAPGAKWMTCKGCREDGCTESDLLACAEFMTCPTDTNGENKQCDKAPYVINNSWGGGQGETFFMGAVNTWLRAGIFPVFANGNSGPACQTANSPADANIVIAVGATDSSDALGSFSSKGPTVKGITKPDVSAPGVKIRSAAKSGDNAYAVLSGTSMAAPHVSGIVALILKAKPTISYEELRQLVTKGVDTASLKPTGQSCGGIPDGKFPNNGYGYGRVNVAQAIKI